MQPKASQNINTLKCLYLVLCLLGLYSTSVNALVEYNPIQKKSQQAKHYAQTLNQVATIVMGHYANLLKNQSTHLGNYPKNIKNIQIIDAKLKGIPSQPKQQIQTEFTVTIQLNYLENHTIKTQQIQEAFIFNLNKDNPLVQIVQLQQALNSRIIASEFDALHYLNRQFAYSWLLLLDGYNTPHSDLFDDNSANYQLVIGTRNYSGTVHETLKKRTAWMGKGAHLLRSIKAVNTSNNTIQLSLIIDWKGVSANNKWSIAKIKQIIEIKKIDRGIYKIIDVNEQHLLPDIAPWEKILC